MKVYANIKGETKMTYASFWKRVAAYIVDIFIYTILCFIIGQVLGFIVGPVRSLSSVFVLLVSGVSILFSTVCYLFYFVYTEASPAQATLGKRLFGLKVTDLEGKRISFARSLGRNLGTLISTLTLWIGYLMCLWTQQKQCLHDKMADCLVLDTTPQRKQTGLVCTVIGVYVLVFGCSLVWYFSVLVPQIQQAIKHNYEQRIAQQQQVNDSDENLTPLMVASTYGNARQVAQLIKEGADVNAKTDKGTTALMKAVLNNHLEVANLLIKAGADVHVEDELHNNLLVIAVYKSNPRMVDLLLRAGANPNSIGVNEYEELWPALAIASRENNVEIMELLLNARADVNAQSSVGATALMVASAKGNVRAVLTLLQAKANPDATDKEGWTALMTASRHGHYYVVDMLIKAGANVNAQNQDGNTALGFASGEGRLPVVKALLKAGADVNLGGINGQSPLVLAEKNKHFDVAAVLREAGAKE